MVQWWRRLAGGAASTAARPQEGGRQQFNRQQAAAAVVMAGNQQWQRARRGVPQSPLPPQRAVRCTFRLLPKKGVVGKGAVPGSDMCAQQAALFYFSHSYR